MPDEQPIRDGAGTQQFEAVMKSIHELTETLKSKQADRPKDKWDKFNALSPFVTGLIVAVVGGIFTYNEGRRNEILRLQEIANGKRQAAQDTLTKEHQARALELQTIAQFMPYLTSKREDSKQVAITAIKALSNTSLAIELAALNKSPGTISAVRQIAMQSTNESDRKLAQAALVELEKPVEGPNKTLLKTELGDCGPEGAGGDKATNLLKNRTDMPPKFADLTIKELEQSQVPDVPLRRDSWTTEETADVKRLGEGQAIRVQGYLLAARKERGNTANCAFQSYTDWHLVIGPSPETPSRDALVAVVGPRIRISHPNWSLAQLRQLASAKVPVRVSGWQFFDQQHLPQDKSETLRFRATPWEVRPVLKIELLQDRSWRDLDTAPVESSAGSGRKMLNRASGQHVVREVIRSRPSKTRRQPFAEVNAPVKLLRREEVNRECNQHSWRNPQSEEYVQPHHGHAVNREERDHPDGRTPQVHMLGFPYAAVATFASASTV